MKACVTSLSRISSRPVVRGLGTVAAAFILVVLGSRSTQDAIANGDTRTLSIHHAHTKESVTVTFKRDGRYDSRALDSLNWVLRDWRRDEPTRMDPRLFDIVWEVHRSVGSSEPVHVVSAYRSPATNSMLRRRSRGVAKHSQHTLGKAMDFYLPDVEMSRVRAIGMRLQHGGVGYYPNSHNQFVHLDSGSVRSWPRMPRDQLARLFPDGRTVHLPADGKPLSGYDEARSMIMARGGSVAGYASYAEAEESATSGGGRSLWAALFGGGEDEAEEVAEAAPRGRAARTAQRPPRTTALASLPPSSANTNDAGSATFFSEPVAAAPPAPVRTAVTPRRPAPPPEPAPETRVAALPAPPDLSAVPLPVARPRNLVEESRVAGLADPGADAPAPQARTLLAPLPPRRPDEEAPAVVFAAAPLPPLRPQTLTDGPAERPVPGAPAVSPALVAVAHPIPPLRPGSGAAASGPTPAPPPAAVTASLAPPAAAPVAAAAAAPRAAPRGFPPTPRVDQDRAALSALFAAVATEAAPKENVRVSAARRASTPVSGEIVAEKDTGLDLGFGRRDEPPQGRFAGPAVRPLPVRR